MKNPLRLYLLRSLKQKKNSQVKRSHTRLLVSNASQSQLYPLLLTDQIHSGLPVHRGHRPLQEPQDQVPHSDEDRLPSRSRRQDP